MLRREGGAATTVVLLAMLQAACSGKQTFGDGDPYARCADLGDLALLSSSQTDAQQQMVAQVVALGGDTLLFGVRGRTGRLAAPPEEIVLRRSGLLAEDETSNPPVAVATAEPEPEVAELPEGAVIERPRAGRAVVDPIPDPTGELWYYGAALRCKLAE